MTGSCRRSPVQRPAVGQLKGVILHKDVFDNDEGNTVTQVTDKGQTLSWGNGVFSMCLPRPTHIAPAETRWCIEMLYPEADFKRADAEGRRLFLATEFKAQTSKHQTLDAYTVRSRGNHSPVVITSDVFAFNGEKPLALSKIGFVKLIERHAPGGTVDFSAFARLFEELAKIQAGSA